MVLIGDIGGEDETAVAEAASQVVAARNARGAEGFVAVSAENRHTFCSTARAPAAIARHTKRLQRSTRMWSSRSTSWANTRGIERINIEALHRHKVALSMAAERILSPGSMPLRPRCRGASALEPRTGSPSAHDLVAMVQARWCEPARRESKSTFRACAIAKRSCHGRRNC